jgi:hypothetical protein
VRADTFEVSFQRFGDIFILMGVSGQYVLNIKYKLIISSNNKYDNKKKLDGEKKFLLIYIHISTRNFEFTLPNCERLSYPKMEVKLKILRGMTTMSSLAIPSLLDTKFIVDGIPNYISS